MMLLAQTAVPNPWTPAVVVIVVLLVVEVLLHMRAETRTREIVAQRTKTFEDRLESLKEIVSRPQTASLPAELRETIERIGRAQDEIVEKVNRRQEVPAVVETPRTDPLEGWMTLPSVDWSADPITQARQLSQAASAGGGQGREAAAIRERIRLAADSLTSAASDLSSSVRPSPGTMAVLVDRLYAGDLPSPLVEDDPDLVGLIAAYDRLRTNLARWLAQRHDIAPIRPLPMVDAFDPDLHEPMAGSPGRAELPEHDGKVAEVWRPGVTCRGEVVEKARVRWLRYDPPEVAPVTATKDDL